MVQSQSCTGVGSSSCTSYMNSLRRPRSFSLAGNLPGEEYEQSHFFIYVDVSGEDDLRMALCMRSAIRGTCTVDVQLCQPYAARHVHCQPYAARCVCKNYTKDRYSRWGTQLLKNQIVVKLQNKILVGRLILPKKFLSAVLLKVHILIGESNFLKKSKNEQKMPPVRIELTTLGL